MTRPAPAGYVDAGVVNAHVRALLNEGGTIAAVCRAAGVKRARVEHVMRGGKWLLEANAVALLSVRIEECLTPEGVTDAAPVRAHLQRLLEVDDLTRWQLRKQVGVDPRTFTRLLDPSVITVKKGVADRVLAVQPGDIRSTRLRRVSAAPAQAHIEALVAMNVTYEQIAERAGVHPHTVSRIGRGQSEFVDEDTVEWITGVPLTLGEETPVEAQKVRDHILGLIAAGVNRRQIATLAGVSITAVKQIELAMTQTTTREIAELILAVTPQHQWLVNPWADAEQVRAHVVALNNSGVPLKVIAEHAGLTGSQVWRIHNGQPGRVTVSLAQRLFAVTPATVRLPETTHVQAVGTVRRIQALNCAGWPTKELARRLGLTGLNLTHRKRVSKATADRISALYEDLRRTPGPSPRTATWARNKGFVPARYWDADTIDDPTAKPVASSRPSTPRRMIQGARKSA